MARVHADQKGPYTYVRVNGKRKKLQLKKYTEEAAQTICHHVTQLESALAAKAAIPAETQTWLTSIAGDLHQRLAKLGLCRSFHAVSLAEGIAAYLNDGKRELSRHTVTTKAGHLAKLEEFAGGDTPLGDITEDQMQDYATHIAASGLVDSTVCRRIGEAKAMFRFALEKGFCRLNPLDWYVGKSHPPVGEMTYVETDRIEKIITYAPTPEWGLLIAFARYGGVRVPSEVRELQWRHIDWDRRRIHIISPKTKGRGRPTRDIPLYRELAKHLEPLKKSSGYVLGDRLRLYKSFGTPWKQWLERIGEEMWPRPFNSLRSSRITDLLKARKPVQSVAKWMGNSPNVIWEHYAQVIDDDAADLV